MRILIISCILFIALQKEAKQQKFKLDQLRTKISINRDDYLELRENVLSNRHNIKTIDGTFVDLKRNLSSLQNIVESNVRYITVMRRHEMQMDKSIIRTKTENKQQIEDLNETIVSLKKNVSSLQNKIDLYGVTITAMQRNELHKDKSIIKMKTENTKQIEDLKKTIARLQSDHNDVQFSHVETKEQLIQTKMLLQNELLSLQNNVESTEVNILKAIEKDNLQRERKILEMKPENLRYMKEIFNRLQSDRIGTKAELEEIKKHLKQNFRQIIGELKNVYTVTERINVRIEKLEAHRPHDTGILLMIKKGISMLAKIAFDFFLGPLAEHID